ncbi:MAG: serine hydrolase [Acidobacteriaceae bacterium]|nr:serine hydrolase [Acidobacteriaceae bacterium]
MQKHIWFAGRFSPIRIRSTTRRTVDIRGLVFSTLFLSASCIAQPGNVAAMAQSPDDNADAILRRAMADRGIPGMQAAVVKDGKVVFLRSYGEANLQTPVPVSNATVFSINSITKAFTGVAIMQEVEKGKLDLSAPISTYLPNIPPSWGAVTVRQLAGQISGLPDIFSYGGDDTDKMGLIHEDKAWQWALAQPPSPRGEKEYYNQTNLALAQRIVDRLEGLPPDTPIIGNELSIAGMTATSFGASPEVTKNKSGEYVYEYDGLAHDGVLHNEVFFFGPMMRASSGLNSSVGDMTRWMLSILNGKQLSKASLRTLWTPALLNNGTPSSFAVGWGVDKKDGYFKVGMIGGERAAVYLYPELNAGVVILTNLRGANPEEFADEIAALFVPGIKLSAVQELRAEAERSNFVDLEAVFARIKAEHNRPNYDEQELRRWAQSLQWSGGHSARAVVVSQFLVALFPESKDALAVLARAYTANAQPEEANRTYRLLLIKDPGNQEARAYLKLP